MKLIDDELASKDVSLFSDDDRDGEHKVMRFRVSLDHHAA
jgi:hypothetical protein